jgi:V/A-type H+-transporting ATPase subunit A
VRIGELGLFGEVISLRGEEAIVQTYESTEGVRPGEPAVGLGWPLSVELGPGLLGGIFDGVQRPLEKIALQSVATTSAAAWTCAALDRDQGSGSSNPIASWNPGARIGPGTVLGTVQETQTIRPSHPGTADPER